MRIVPNIPIFHKASWVDNVLDENTGMLANKKVIIAIKMPIYSKIVTVQKSISKQRMILMQNIYLF